MTTNKVRLSVRFESLDGSIGDPLTVDVEPSLKDIIAQLKSWGFHPDRVIVPEGKETAKQVEEKEDLPSYKTKDGKQARKGDYVYWQQYRAGKWVWAPKRAKIAELVKHEGYDSFKFLFYNQEEDSYYPVYRSARFCSVEEPAELKAAKAKKTA